MRKPAIAVVMLAHEKPQYLERALWSLAGNAGGPVEWVVVDNGSGPEVAEVLDRFEPVAASFRGGLKRRRFETNVGAVRGRNEALRLVESEYVALADNDILARTRGWAAKLAAVLAMRPEVGVVGPKLVYPWEPTNIQCAGCLVTSSGRVVFRGRDEPRTDPRFALELECPCLISACWMMRTETFARLGPLDEDFSPVQFEDIDYCYRIRQAGQTCLYHPAVEMYHFEGMTTVRTPGLSYDRVTAANALKFKRKWREAILREGGPPDSDAPKWKLDVGWRPVDEIGRLETID